MSAWILLRKAGLGGIHQLAMSGFRLPVCGSSVLGVSESGAGQRHLHGLGSSQHELVLNNTWKGRRREHSRELLHNMGSGLITILSSCHFPLFSFTLSTLTALVLFQHRNIITTQELCTFALTSGKTFSHLIFLLQVFALQISVLMSAPKRLSEPVLACHPACAASQHLS